MKRRPPLVIASAILLAAGLVSCGGTPTAIDAAAQQEAAGSTLATGGTGDVSTLATGGTGDVSSPAGGQATSPGSSRTPGGSRAGAPGPDPAAGGGGSGGSRPGGPFDVEAFENRGELIAEFRPFAQAHCSGGRCILVEKTSEAADAQEGCEVADFAYEPKAQPPDAPPADQFIQRGTTVTVYVHCPPGPDAGGSPAGGSSTGPSTEEGTSSSSSSESSSSSSSSSESSSSESSSDGSGG